MTVPLATSPPAAAAHAAERVVAKPPAFWAHVAGTIGTRGILVAFGLVGAVVSARVLGPAGFGALAVIFALGTLGVQLANAGLPSAVAYYVAGDARRLPALIGASLLCGVGAGTAVALVGFHLLQSVPGLAPLPAASWIALAMIWIPLGVTQLLLLNLLLGLQRMKLYNGAQLAQAVLGLILLLAVVAVGRASVESLFLASFVPLAAVTLAIAAGLVRAAGRVALPGRALIRQAAGYGTRAWLALLFSWAVMRLDILMVGRMLGPGEAGQYAVAAAAGDLALLPFSALGAVLFASVSGGSIGWSFTRRVTLLSLFAAMPFFLAAAALAPWGIDLVFGAAYGPSVAPLLWLLPGLWLFGANTVLMHYFAGIGMPRITVYAPGFALAANVLLNLMLIPRLGISGAAIASTICYALMLCCSAAWLFRRRT